MRRIRSGALAWTVLASALAAGAVSIEAPPARTAPPPSGPLPTSGVDPTLDLAPAISAPGAPVGPMLGSAARTPDRPTVPPPPGAAGRDAAALDHRRRPTSWHGDADSPPRQHPAGRRPTLSGPSNTPAYGWPLTVRGTITRGYSGSHQAVDIAAPPGTPVRAIARGVVTWAGWRNDGGGNVVVIRHHDGMVSIYNHNRDVAVSAGDRVQRGDRIASVGSTGFSLGPHLDLRIEMAGRLVDPLALY